MTLRGMLHHFNNRISEVANALILVGLGVQIIAAPVPTDYRALDMLLRYVSGEFISALFIAVGTIRMAALVANGRWPKYGPWLRSIGALIGALIWSQMFLGLIAVKPDDLTSLGAPVYFVFTLVELISIYRALAMRDRYGRGI
jgi:hypothetical protein